MAAYVRELMVDSIYGSSLIEDVVDLNSGLKELLRRGDITLTHIWVLSRYLSGYTLSELLLRRPDAKELLVQVTSLLEAETSYTDEYIIKLGLNKFPRYKKITEALRRYILYYGRTFDSIDTQGANV